MCINLYILGLWLHIGVVINHKTTKLISCKARERRNIYACAHVSVMSYQRETSTKKGMHKKQKPHA
jgi:hypothetical protein